MFSPLVKDFLLFDKINLLFPNEKLFFKKNSFKKTFKSMFNLDKGLLEVSTFKTKSFFKNNVESSFTKDLFKSFIFLNTWIPTPTLQVHETFNIFYMYNSYSNVGFFNVKKVFDMWSKVIIFITNVFFYNLRYLAFGNSYFKYEVLSLNWSGSNFTKRLWRFSHPFIFFLKNRTTLENTRYFRHLSYLGFRIAFITDTVYHSRTIYYFNRSKSLTIGPVPVSSNFYTLNVTLPVASNLNFSNLFFIRLLMKLKKNNAKLIFTNYKNIKY